MIKIMCCIEYLLEIYVICVVNGILLRKEIENMFR